MSRSSHLKMLRRFVKRIAHATGQDPHELWQQLVDKLQFERRVSKNRTVTLIPKDEFERQQRTDAARREGRAVALEDRIPMHRDWQKPVPKPTFRPRLSRELEPDNVTKPHLVVTPEVLYTYYRYGRHVNETAAEVVTANPTTGGVQQLTEIKDEQHLHSVRYTQMVQKMLYDAQRAQAEEAAWQQAQARQQTALAAPAA